MRILSQDGMVNIPYDTSVITRVDGIIRAKCGSDDVYIMAEYANPDVATLEMKVMNLTCEASGQKNRVFQFSEDPGI